jgi:phosphoribosylaminoimidazole carboxylase (NCAIR synthetase)
MFAIEARKLGYRVATFSPESDTPTGQVADIEITAHYEDLEAVADFAKKVNVVTFEFENVPSACIETASKFVQVHPKGEVLHTTQNRLREKTFLSENGFPVTPFKHIKTLQDFENVTFPAVLKTAGFGYDGKGQAKLKSADDIEKKFPSSAPATQKEISPISALSKTRIPIIFWMSVLHPRLFPKRLTVKRLKLPATLPINLNMSEQCALSFS